ncbi:MAG: GNAT family N-acetyltransferase [Clostridia bacterium]|nr:GNAT family N-acetyltransferase [Clostridia bacterium]
MEIYIRPAVPEDHGAVAGIIAQVQRMHVDWRPDIYRPNDDLLPLEAFADECARGLAFVAECDGQVAGVMEIVYRHIETPAHVTRDIVFVDTMAVDEPFRGKGIGKAFFHYLKQMKEEKQLDGIELQVNAKNTAALRMYEKCGFTFKSINMELLD